MTEIAGLVGFLISLVILIYVLTSIHRIKHATEDSRDALRRLVQLAESQTSVDGAVRSPVPAAQEKKPSRPAWHYVSYALGSLLLLMIAAAALESLRH